MKRQLKPLFTALLLACMAMLCINGSIKAQALNIKNDIFWKTKDGEPIYSQGGGIFMFTDPVSGKKKYYWYGVHYAQAETYRANPSVTPTGSTFGSVTCYSSTDLVNWALKAMC